MDFKDVEFKSNEISKEDIKSHNEIIKIIEDVKKYEEKLKPYEDIEVDFIDADKNEIFQTDVSTKETEVDLDQFGDIIKKRKKVKKKGKIRIKRRKKHKPFEEVFEDNKRVKTKKQKPRKEIKAATFRLRFDEEGHIENKDFRKSKPHSESKIAQTKIFKKITSILKLKKGEEKTEEEYEVKEGEKPSKIKGIFGKLGGITSKLPIPKKGGKKEKTEEENEE